MPIQQGEPNLGGFQSAMAGGFGDDWDRNNRLAEGILEERMMAG